MSGVVSEVVVVGVDAHSAIEALHGFEKTELLVVANGPLGQSDLRGKLPDAILADRRRHAISPERLCQFTSTGSQSIPPAPGSAGETAEDEGERVGGKRGVDRCC